MILDLEPIFNNEGEHLSINYELDLSAESLSGVLPFKNPVEIRGEVRNCAGVVELDVLASFVLSLACDRCAKPIELKQQSRVNHTLVTSINDEKNDELLLLREMRFNLDELVTEDIILDMPSKFLCSDSCLGVCPDCGKDLNEGPCSCKKASDPKLDVLNQLLDN